MQFCVFAFSKNPKIASPLKNRRAPILMILKKFSIARLGGERACDFKPLIPSSSLRSKSDPVCLKNKPLLTVCIVYLCNTTFLQKVRSSNTVSKLYHDVVGTEFGGYFWSFLDPQKWPLKDYT